MHLAPLYRLYGLKPDGIPLETIEATARPDNPASGRILEKVGLGQLGEEIKFGALRFVYGAKVDRPEI